MNRWLKRILIALGGLVGILVLAAAAVYGASSARLRRTMSVASASVPVPADAASIERGRHFVVAIGKCGDCHGDDLGGKVFIDDPAFGHVVAPNLTRGRGGVGGASSNADWERAIRHGVARNGRPLLIMPSMAFTYLSDEDAGAIIAYVKSVPPVEREFAATTVGPVARALMVTGKASFMDADRIDHAARAPASVKADTTAEYGMYLARVGGCTYCHGASLSGGPAPEPGAPVASNLTPASLGGWTEAHFVSALRTGKRPDGSALRAPMPWQSSGKMTDAEIRAMWMYLRSLPPKKFAES